jgi:hypothetical protein
MRQRFILFTGAIAVLGVGLAFAAGLLYLPSVAVLATHGPWHGGTLGTTIDITLSAVPPGYDVSGGTYPGWCAEDNHQANSPPNEAVFLLDSTDPASFPAGSGYDSVPWDKVNYLLNHRGLATAEGVQVAIWLLTGTYDGTFPGAYAEGFALYTNADANGGDFLPGTGDIVVVILYGDGFGPSGYQDTMIEVGFRGMEGCTPGYWKNHHDAWPVADAPFDSIFGVGPDMMLSEALELKGGGEKAFLRHAAAAYLNAVNPEVNYFYTLADVHTMVNAAYVSGEFEIYKDMFDVANNLGCPL